MLILGWHGHSTLKESEQSHGFAHHDAAAVILRDGKILAAIEEERLNRVKHSNVFPVRAIRHCLREAGADIRDLDAIVTDTTEQFFDLLAAREAVSDPRRPFMRFRERVATTFADTFNADVAGKLHFCRHHIAHLHGAWQPSGFSEALVLCIDGSGDGASGIVARCDGQQVDVLRYLTPSQSLGDFYCSSIGYLGYGRFDEYKVMGLAPYGDPNCHSQLFRKFYELLPGGRFSLLPLAERTMLLVEAGLAQSARRRGQTFTQAHRNFAAALQAALERIVNHILDFHRRETAMRRLCLSGGVAHNCTLNGQILRSNMFSEVYVQPLAHDAGNALGAALWWMKESGVAFDRGCLPHLFWGTGVGNDDQIGARLERWGSLLDIERVSDAAETAAELIARGEVVAWVQGRSEFGPRALGNRSILADPRPAENRDVINAMVKKREGYRPFAPAVTEERLKDYFEVPTGIDRAPFMCIVLSVRPHVRRLLGAVTHVDGTARVQSVSQRDNPRFHTLIQAFERKTGVPVVLNTSFNNNAEPIVDSVDDAVACFLTTGLSALIIGNWRVRKSLSITTQPAFLDLVPTIPESCKLVRVARPDGQLAFCLERTASHHFVEQNVEISEDAFRVLLDGRPDEPLRLGIPRIIPDCPTLPELLHEFYSLWERRVIVLGPARLPAKTSIW